MRVICSSEEEVEVLTQLLAGAKPSYKLASKTNLPHPWPDGYIGLVFEIDQDAVYENPMEAQGLAELAAAQTVEEENADKV